MKDLLKHIVKEESLNYLLEKYPTPRLLLSASESELIKAPGIGIKKVKELKSILELSKLLLEPSKEDAVYIKKPKDVYDFLKIISLYEEEHGVVILLDNKNKVINHFLISIGSLNSAVIHPREVFTPAIRNKACSIIFIHNHPSGDSEPSNEDISISKRLEESGKLLGIELLDSIIIGSGSYTSLKEKGVL